MVSTDDVAGRARQVLDREEIETVLSGAFYTPGASVRSTSDEGVVRQAGGAGEKPLHYKVICISLYNQDLANLDKMVEELKARGMTKANRSALIRFALSQVDIEKVPRGL